MSTYRTDIVSTTKKVTFQKQNYITGKKCTFLNLVMWTHDWQDDPGEDVSSLCKHIKKTRVCGEK